MAHKLKYHFSSDSSEPGAESSSYQRYTVDRGVDSSRTAQFIVEGQHDSFIDLSNIYVKTTFRVTKEDGSEVGASPIVFPTENYGTNLWSQVSVSLNNTTLPPGNDYPYTAIFIDAVGATQDNRNTVAKPLSGSKFSGYNSSKIIHALGVTYRDNKKLCGGSKPIDVYGRVYSDFLMSCSQLLPSGMQLGVALTRSKDSFVLGVEQQKEKVKDAEGKEAETLKTPEAYRVEVQSVSLFVKRVQLNAAARSLVEAGLAQGGRLLYQRLHTLAFPCSKATRTWNWHNCFNSIAPRRVFVALVTQEAYFGDLLRTSNYLESANVSSVSFRVDGREVMAEPYTSFFVYGSDGQVDDGSSDAKSAFAGLCRVMGTFSSPRQSLGFSYEYFLNGATMWAVALGDDVDEVGQRPGSLDVAIDFAAPTQEPLMVLVMGEYPKTLVFDSNRNITNIS